jgi:predicted DNA-binding protein (MmcQ/YjbR family)
MNINDFSGREYIPSKLKEYGFKRKKEGYFYTKPILDGQFEVNVVVTSDNVTVDVYDVFAEDNYYLHLVEDASGGFVGQVRSEYENLINDIGAHCFKPAFVFGEVGKAVVKYAGKRYHSELEFLWKEDDCAILRRKANKKWYAVFMCVQRKKLGIEGEEKIAIVDLRAPKSDIARLVDNKNYFKAWHMNKQSWITIPLDGRVSPEVINWLLDMSYDIAGSKK